MKTVKQGDHFTGTPGSVVLLQRNPDMNNSFPFCQLKFTTDSLRDIREGWVKYE